MLSLLLFFLFCQPFTQAISEDDLYSEKDITFDLDSSFSSVECYNADCAHQAVKRETVEIETVKDYIKYLLRGNKTKDDHFNTEPYVYGNTTIGKHLNPTTHSIHPN